MPPANPKQQFIKSLFSPFIEFVFMLSSIPCNCYDIKAFHSSLLIAADVATPLIQSRLQIAHPDEAQCLQSFTFYLLPAFRSNEIIKEKSKLNDIVWKAGAKEKSRD